MAVYNDLTGKVVLITGGAGGLGVAVAKAFSGPREYSLVTKSGGLGGEDVLLEIGGFASGRKITS